MAGTVEQQQRMQLIKGERHLFSSSDDATVMKQILATHAPDGREVEVRPILKLVEDILRRATPTVVMVPQAHELELVEDKAQQYEVTSMLEALAYPIHRISSEITYKCSGGGEVHATALALFQTLSTYTWDAKLVLTLAAFAVTYGGFWLSAQIHSVNPLAKSIAQLKQLPDILEQTDVLKPRFDAINNLIKAMLDVTKCIIEFKELPTEYIPLDSPDINLAMAHIPTAVYWIVRSVLACASQIIALIGLGHEYMSSTTEAWELSSLAHKVANIHGHLRKQLSLCHRIIDDKKDIEIYQTLVRLFETIHLDNMKILKALIYSKDDLPLIEGTTKKRVRVDVLRRKIVLLFITDLDITPEELFVLIQIYNDTHQGKVERHYEIVWLPIINLHVSLLPSKEATFDQLSSVMPWYSLQHPALLDKAVVKYIRDMWHFDKKPILVVLDPQGKVVCPNALHMMWIWVVWHSFHKCKEEALWKEETWRLELLIDEIDPTIVEWAREGRDICLYGGERHRLDKKKNKKIISIIAAEKLSSYAKEPAMIWFFWVRIESMWHSKRQHGAHSLTPDQIMQEVTQMLSFDSSDEGWAVFSRGLMEIIKSSKVVTSIV
ncbi:protein SIEVE ELEMENT OCCLUSION B-like [Dioscorea cayenensis subsp. rotundata]|uniref:Protein SIEVE ELEMENT OCCLUSION B-like n=1 Tax=Dioscorea cayennensis subsp. rotundata TaxID=55577 RepID=A0AB40C0D7_DIOCR|nr:protein SIEVE ELEMENT OCCLUSION B-like [Dioscorea cayenensis subsp. rotundata]